MKWLKHLILFVCFISCSISYASQKCWDRVSDMVADAPSTIYEFTTMEKVQKFDFETYLSGWRTLSPIFYCNYKDDSWVMSALFNTEVLTPQTESGLIIINDAGVGYARGRKQWGYDAESAAQGDEAKKRLEKFLSEPSALRNRLLAVAKIYRITEISISHYIGEIDVEYLGTLLRAFHQVDYKKKADKKLYIDPTTFDEYPLETQLEIGISMIVAEAELSKSYGFPVNILDSNYIRDNHKELIQLRNIEVGSKKVVKTMSGDFSEEIKLIEVTDGEKPTAYNAYEKRNILEVRAKEYLK